MQPGAIPRRRLDCVAERVPQVERGAHVVELQLVCSDHLSLRMG